jgi:hypothetical protein
MIPDTRYLVLDTTTTKILDIWTSTAFVEYSAVSCWYGKFGPKTSPALPRCTWLASPLH